MRDSGARADIACTIGAVGVDVERPGSTLDDLFRDYHFLNVLKARQIEHSVDEDALHDRPQAPGPGLRLEAAPLAPISKLSIR